MSGGRSISGNDTKPSILFIHMGFAGQFEFFGKWLAQNGWDVTIAYNGDEAPKIMDRIRVLTFRARIPVMRSEDYRYCLDYAASNALGATELLYRMRYQEEYIPDVVMAHVGWGVGLCAKQLWPETCYIAYHEWYYTDTNWADGGRAERPVTLGSLLGNRMRNLPIVAEFDSADANWCPTKFQASRFPPLLQSVIKVIPDGVDCEACHPDPDACIDFDWLSLPKEIPILTYATRGMEPLRGFPQFMRAVELLQHRQKDFHTIIVANENVSYGAKLPQGDSWRLRMNHMLDLDHRRLHVFPMRPRDEYQRLLQASWAHVYFSEPFVTSWSLSDAMATGCYIVGSNTGPVCELLTDSETGALVDMDDPDEVAKAIEWAFDNVNSAQKIGLNARDFILQDYEAARVFRQKDLLMRDMISKRRQSRRPKSPY